MPENNGGGVGDRAVTRRRMIGTGAAGLGLLLAGCSGDGGGNGNGNGNGNGTATDEPMEALHGWTGGDGAAAAQEIVDAWEEEYPDWEHQIEPIGGDANVNLNSTVARRLANRNPPSAFAGWPGANMTQYGGMLKNMTPVYEEEGFEDVIHQKALDACKMNDEYRAVPLGSHRLNNLFYNVNVLEDAGVDPADVTDWDSFLTARETIANDTDYLPVTTTTTAPWTYLQYWGQIMLGTEGQDAYEAVFEGEGNREAVVRALEKTEEFTENHTNNDRATLSFPEANDAIINGEAAFFTMGNWAAGMYRNAEGFNYEEDWGWLPFPGTGDMYVWHLDSFMFPRDGPAPVKANAFGSLIGSADLQIAFNNLKGSIPLRTDIGEDELHPFLNLNVKHLNEFEKFPPTVAHGLACPPEQLDGLKGAIADNFSDSFDHGATADAMLEVFA